MGLAIHRFRGSVRRYSWRTLTFAYRTERQPHAETSGRTVSALQDIVGTGILVTGAIAGGQLAWLGMDKLIALLGTEPRDWLAAKLRSDG